MAIHPVQTARRLREAYIRYLKTIKPFQNERLRHEFGCALEAENMLVKGPYLELTPPFTPGKMIQELIDEKVLSARFVSFCHNEGGLRLDRPLYWHQEKSVIKAQEGHNLIITTGTGSGKTESFLIPILDWLAREAEAGTLEQKGVRTLLLYPMNALANDQMERLRGYLKKIPKITFGRYVGDTKHTDAEALEFYEQIHHCKPQENELISRPQMQANPPHILLTNYAMLEYLLLRPADTALFDGETGKHWRFIVLDEAHAYDGAQATEIAMLLRRLQDRVTQGGEKKLQAFAASATLGEDTTKIRAEISEFAQKLFNLDFHPANVIFSKCESDSGLTAAWGSGTSELYDQLETLAESHRQEQPIPWPDSLPGIEPSRLKSACQKSEHSKEPLPRLLYELLSGDANIHLLRKTLQNAPLLLEQTARQVFPTLEQEYAQHALANLVSVSILAREHNDKLPLLPARYHLFARALEGAFICLNKSHPVHNQEGKPLLFLNRQKFCEHCGSRVFELANCTRCGESYLIGDERDGYELPKSEFSQSNPRDQEQTYLIQNSVIYENEQEARRLCYFVLDSLDAATADEDALIEGEMDAGQEPNEKTEPAQICPRCGAVSEPGDPLCKCSVPPIRISRVEMGKKRTLERCVSCSTYTKGGVIYRFLTGQDAPVSVLAGTLYRDVPQAKENSPEREHPGGGRKLLVFTDNRQRAAFFAPYLERAQERQLRRRLMVESLNNISGGEPLRFSDWLDILLTYAKKADIFPVEESLRDKRLTIATWLMLEFSGVEKRLGLEGVGLLYFRPFHLSNWHPPQELLSAPWNFSPEEAYQVLAILLNTLRRQGAVTFLLNEEGIDLWDSAKKNQFRPRTRPYYVHETQAGNYFKFGVYSWLPSERYNNSRRDYLSRLLARKKDEKTPSEETLLQAGQLLQQLWCSLTSVSRGNWFEQETQNRVGVVYRLKHNLWEVIPTFHNLTPWSVCDKCQNLSVFNVSGVCPTYGCKGKLQPLAEQAHVIQDNLYRYQYQEEAPLVLKAMEHTAQWTSTRAAEIQKDFISGKVNALSCSTTFEMGVNIGDLNAILLRNVPPSTANYIQRAGRARIRSDSVAMVVTFAQRRQHDLTFYAEPERMIAGMIRPPIVPLKNEKIIRRHLHSVAFAAYLRWIKESRGYEYRYTGDFFAPDDQARNGLALFKTYLYNHPPEIKAALQRIVPTNDPDLLGQLQLDQWGWLTYLINSRDAVLDNASITLTGELSEFRRIEEKAASERNYREADQARRVQYTICKRDLLGYLGSKNVLPKYGFPTDVVSLQTDHLNISGANEIELDRDLKQAISEFAPGGQVVAAGKIWYSRGVKRLPGRDPVLYRYAICKHCNRINIVPGEQSISHCLCGQPVQGTKGTGVYIIPEYGFIADNKTDIPGENPPARIYASRVYLANYSVQSNLSSFDPCNVEPDPNFDAGVRVLKGYTRNAYLGLVNNGYGSGFHVCSACGWTNVIEYKAGKPTKHPKEHSNPLTHEKCTTGSLASHHLGHHFMTDVLQLRFSLPISGESEAYSLLYAILDGASGVLEIPRSDVDGLIFYQENEPSFLLYDTTPGGSGYVEMINNHLHAGLEAAYKRVAHCEGCKPDTSCYSCLRGYHNQFVHDKLVRGLAADLLGQVLGK